MTTHLLDMKNQVIGICGYAGAGKDTAFLTLRDIFPQLRLHRAAFADPLKEDLKGCEEALKRYCQADLKSKENKDKFRSLWVEWSKVSKLFDPMIWVKRTWPVIHELKKRGWVCVTDVRYDFEVIKLRKEKKGFILFVDRPGVGPANEEEEKTFKAILEQFPEFHPGGTHYICNDGTPEQLAEKLKARICEEFNIQLTETACERCERVVNDIGKPCRVCGKTVCRNCFMLNVSKGYICLDCAKKE